MRTLFISDLHLDEQHPEMTGLFLKFLKTEAIHAEALYILGDFFETWIGDDDQSTFHDTIIQALREVTEQGIPVYFLHGNRDFLLGKKFFRQTGCKLLPDEYVINLYGTPTLLMHGDTLCTQDIAYLKFRKKARNIFFQKMFLLKSLKKRRLIAEDMREKSRQYTSTQPEYIMDVTPAEVERVMLKHGVKRLIHGHTHREAVHSLMVDGMQAERVVLGAWHGCGSMVVCDAKGGAELVPL